MLYIAVFSSDTTQLYELVVAKLMKKLTLPNLYSQLDNRWANELLGFNTDPKYNIRDFGCLISNLAVISCLYGVYNTPSTINALLKANKEFSNGGFYNWGGLNRLLEQVTEEKWVGTPARLTDAQMNEIKSSIDAGYPVMLQLDYNPKTVALDMHYVLAFGYNDKDENDITIHDPIGGAVVSLKKYLGWFKPSARNTIEQYIIYKGKAVESTDSLLKKIQDLNTQISTLQTNINSQLANKDKECQNKILQVKNKIMEVANSL